MVVPSKGDRKNIHTLEYCQYGKGWEVDERNSVKFMTENGNLCVTKLELKKNDSRRQFVYWFQCHEISCATYSEFITQDTFLK